MITARTSRVAALATNALLERSPTVALGRVEGSPIDLLVDATPVVMDEPATISVEEAIDNARETSMVATYGDGSEHDMVLDEVVPIVVGAINAAKAFAKEVLLPATARADDQVREALTNFTPVRFFVNPHFIAPIFASNALSESISKFAEAAIDTPKKVFAQELDDGILTQMLKTGLPGWDDTVVEFLAAKPEGWLNEVYNGVFGTGYVDSPVLPSHEMAVTFVGFDNKTHISTRIGVEDSLLGAYLLANALYSNPPSSINATLSEWKHTLSLWIQQLGRSLLVFQNQLISQTKSKRMILHFPDTSTIWKRDANEAGITVLGHVYNEWLKEGGSPEIVIGACFFSADKVPLNVLDINDRAKACADMYNGYEQRLALEISDRADDTIKNALKTAFATAIVEAPSECLAAEVHVLQARISELCNNQSHWGKMNIYLFIRTTLGKVVFNRPMALFLLERIDALTVDSDRSPKEAAWMAVRELVVDYVTNQITVTA